MSYVHGSEDFAETGDIASAGTPHGLGHALILFLGSAEGD
jgi:hypothetical protein